MRQLTDVAMYTLLPPSNKTQYVTESLLRGGAARRRCWKNVVKGCQTAPSIAKIVAFAAPHRTGTPRVRYTSQLANAALSDRVPGHSRSNEMQPSLLLEAADVHQDRSSAQQWKQMVAGATWPDCEDSTCPVPDALSTERTQWDRPHRGQLSRCGGRPITVTPESTSRHEESSDDETVEASEPANEKGSCVINVVISGKSTMADTGNKIGCQPDADALVEKIEQNVSVNTTSLVGSSNGDFKGENPEHLVTSSRPSVPGPRRIYSSGMMGERDRAFLTKRHQLPSRPSADQAQELGEVLRTRQAGQSPKQLRKHSLSTSGLYAPTRKQDHSISAPSTSVYNFQARRSLTMAGHTGRASFASTGHTNRSLALYRDELQSDVVSSRHTLESVQSHRSTYARTNPRVEHSHSGRKSIQSFAAIAESDCVVDEDDDPTESDGDVGGFGPIPLAQYGPLCRLQKSFPSTPIDTLLEMMDSGFFVQPQSTIKTKPASRALTANSKLSSAEGQSTRNSSYMSCAKGSKDKQDVENHDNTMHSSGDDSGRGCGSAMETRAAISVEHTLRTTITSPVSSIETGFSGENKDSHCSPAIGAESVNKKLKKSSASTSPTASPTLSHMNSNSRVWPPKTSDPAEARNLTGMAEATTGSMLMFGGQGLKGRKKTAPHVGGVDVVPFFYNLDDLRAKINRGILPRRTDVHDYKVSQTERIFPSFRTSKEVERFYEWQATLYKQFFEPPLLTVRQQRTAPWEFRLKKSSHSVPTQFLGLRQKTDVR